MYIYQKILSSWWKQISEIKLHFFENFNMLCMNLVQSRYYQLQYIGFAKVMAQLSFSFMIVTLIFMSVANCTFVSLGSLLIGGVAH